MSAKRLQSACVLKALETKKRPNRSNPGYALPSDGGEMAKKQSTMRVPQDQLDRIDALAAGPLGATLSKQKILQACLEIGIEASEKDHTQAHRALERAKEREASKPPIQPQPTDKPGKPGKGGKKS